MFPIELGPEPGKFGSWHARVTFGGVSVHQGGFATSYSAYHWALAQWRVFEAAA